MDSIKYFISFKYIDSKNEGMMPIRTLRQGFSPSEYILLMEEINNIKSRLDTLDKSIIEHSKGVQNVYNQFLRIIKIGSIDLDIIDIKIKELKEKEDYIEKLIENKVNDSIYKKSCVLNKEDSILLRRILERSEGFVDIEHIKERQDILEKSLIDHSKGVQNVYNQFSKIIEIGAIDLDVIDIKLKELKEKRNEIDDIIESRVLVLLSGAEVKGNVII